MSVKTDKRIRYTKMVLKQSLLELMQDQPIEKITVKDICLKADINRGTFYSHYANPFELLVSIENELFDEILGSIETSLKAEAISGLLTKIFDTIEKNSDLCHVLFSEYGDKAFLRRIMYIAHDRSIAEWHAVLPGISFERLELLYTFFANGCVAVIQEWLQSGMKTSRDEITHLFAQLTSSSLSAIQT
jgi:AcrR family transcriptional regulator